MINFIRYYPNGSTGPQMIERGPLVEKMAAGFLASGGRYMITIHDDLEVEMVAAIPGRFVGEIHQLARASCQNDPVLPHAVDQLVRDSVAELKRYATRN